MSWVLVASRGRGAYVRGREWEQGLVNFFKKGVFKLERIRSGFHEDMGDLAGLPLFMVEAKAAAVQKIGLGMDKALVSWNNDTAKPFFVMFQKRPNKSLERGWAIMEISQFREFLEFLHDAAVLSPDVFDAWRRDRLDSGGSVSGGVEGGGTE